MYVHILITYCCNYNVEFLHLIIIMIGKIKQAKNQITYVCISMYVDNAVAKTISLNLTITDESQIFGEINFFASEMMGIRYSVTGLSDFGPFYFCPSIKTDSDTC